MIRRLLLALALTPAMVFAQGHAGLCPEGGVEAAEASLAQADTTAALCLVNRLDSAGSLDTRAYLIKAAILRNQRHLPEAVATLLRGIRLSPRDANLRLDLGMTEAMQSHRSLAMAAFDTAERLAPGQARTEVDRGWALTWTGDTAAASSAFTAALQRDARSVGAWNGMGFLATARHDSAQASGYYTRTLQIDPADKQAMSFMNAWRVHLQNIPLRLIPVQTRTPDSVVAQAIKAANLAMASGDRVAARRAVDRLLALDGTNRTALRDDGWLKLWSGNTAGGAERFQGLVGQDPTDVGSLVGLAAARRDAGDAVGARRLYEKALGLDRSNADAIYGLAHTATSNRGEISLVGGYISVDDGRLGTSGTANVTVHPTPELSLALDAGREGVGDIHTTTDLILLNGGATDYLGGGVVFRPRMGPVSFAVRDDHYSGGGEYVNAIDAQVAIDIASRVSLLAGVRPDYSSFLSAWRTGLRGGVYLRVIPDGDILVQALHTNGVRLYGEPATTWSAFGGFTKPRGQLRIGASGSDEAGARFLDPAISALWYATEHWGFRVGGERRYGIFARKTLQLGLTARW